MSDDTARIGILVDPSLLIVEPALARVELRLPGLRAESGLSFHVAPSFLRAVQQPSRLTALTFFAGRLDVLPVNRVRSALAGMDLTPYPLATTDEAGFDFMRESLRARAPNDLVADILYEEWLFATRQSVVIARLKRVFRLLADAGARVVEIVNRLGDESYERLLGRLPEHHVKTLERLGRLKEVTPYIGNGASLAVAVLSLMLGTEVDLPNLVDDLLVVLDP